MLEGPALSETADFALALQQRAGVLGSVDGLSALLQRGLRSQNRRLVKACMRLLRLNKDRLDLTEFADDVRNGFAAGLKGEFSDVFADIEAQEQEKLLQGNDERGENFEEREETEFSGPLNDSACAEDSGNSNAENESSHEVEEEVGENGEEEGEENTTNDVHADEVPEFGTNFRIFLEQLESSGQIYEQIPIRGLQGYLWHEEQLTLSQTCEKIPAPEIAKKSRKQRHLATVLGFKRL